ncbi:MAG TPA: response regulator [Ramlibacter sp.]|uniref:response regulator n=1 Tax=Ramlibacter sp. TaxID=1917967 RepID=UPI002D80E2EC|nr:response regulator [Ramlibacter sp.]HET8744504.1 response regulator [Ramlibacter sp.]
MSPLCSTSTSSDARDAGERTVLVADDDRDSADNLCELLQLLGFGTLVAYDGDEAVDVALRERPPYAILDLHMPRMGGVLACTRIRAQVPPGAMKLVALTGSDSASDREAAQLAGFDHFLLKPVMVSALLHLLRPPAPAP